MSGAHLGYYGIHSENTYNSTFPLTKSGKAVSHSVSHGEIFDDVGGVYLNAREKPYVYHDEGGEIDKAYDFTFDSIVVAPGIAIEIRNEKDELVYTGHGPYMANSNDVPEATLKHLPPILKSLRSKMPDWIQTHLESLNFEMPRIPLHNSSWVKVTRIGNEPCDTSIPE